MVKCHVCSKDMDAKTVTHKIEKDAKTLHFCGEGCQSKYKAAPHKFDKVAK